MGKALSIRWDPPRPLSRAGLDDDNPNQEKRAWCAANEGRHYDAAPRRRPPVPPSRADRASRAHCHCRGVLVGQDHNQTVRDRDRGKSASGTASGAAPTTATASPTATGAATATAALPHPCSLVTQQEAIAISGMQQATVSDDSKFECVYDGTTAAGAAARVAVQLKALSSPAVFTQDVQQSQCAGTSNTTTAVPGVGDEAVQHADCLFVRKGGLEMNLYVVPAPADPNAQAQLARTAVSRF